MLIEERGHFARRAGRDEVAVDVARIQKVDRKKREPRSRLRPHVRIGKEQFILETKDVSEIAVVCDLRTVLIAASQKFKDSGLSLGTALRTAVAVGRMGRCRQCE